MVHRAPEIFRLIAPACLLVWIGCAPESSETDASEPVVAALDAMAGDAWSADAPDHNTTTDSGGTTDAGSGVGLRDASMDSGAGGSLNDGGAHATLDSGARDGGSGDARSAGTTGGGDASSGTSRPDGGGAGATFHVFLLLGQSNMAGYPKAEAADKVEDARVRVLGYDECAATGRHKDAWASASPPLHECWNGAIGPGDYFAKTLLGTIPDGATIGLVPCAISGEKIETFMKAGGSKYDWIISRAKLAQQAGGVIDGILFHQGESNCGDGSWPGKVKTLVSDLKADLGLKDVPFLAGELAPNGNCANHNPLVNQLPGLITNGHVVSAQGLTVDPADTQWHLHFDHASQVTFGKRYAQAMISALNW
jgi:hypothetical protein